MNGIDLEEFERNWTKLGREICQAVYVDPKTQEIKNFLQKKGFLSLEEKSQLINICDTIKYQLIYQKYGPEGSEGYARFSRAWQDWFQSKGVGSSLKRGQRNSVDHILFGSTPDPEQFLLHFEEEMLGSMK